MFTRKTYSRIPKREVRNGLIDVSREELEDFRNRFGKDRTLRDLLNYDRTGKLPEAPKSAEDTRSKGRRAEAPKPEKDPRARGDQGANTLPDTGPAPLPRSVVRVKDNDTIKQERDADIKDKFESTLRSRAEAADRRAMEEVDAQRAERAERRRQEDLKRPGRDAITPTLGPEMGLAAAGRTGLALLANTLASVARRRTADEVAKRVAREEARRDPDLGLPSQGSVWRSNRPPKDDIPTLREVVEPKPRIQVEGTKGGVYRSPKDEAATKPQPEFRSRTADRMDEKEMLKKGGTTKAYAKGGTVRGGGCETKGKTKGRFV